MKLFHVLIFDLINLAKIGLCLWPKMGSAKIDCHHSKRDKMFLPLVLL